MEVTAGELQLEQHHFVLVHGMNHGAWCWYVAVMLLRLAGHRATALDMAGCGVHPARVDEVLSFEDYSRPLLDALAALPPGEQVVLVAHSHGGYSVALAVQRFPEKVAAAVFVTASMPAVGREMAATSDEDLNLGLMLIRPANSFTTNNPEEGVMRDENLLTAGRYGSVRRVFVTVEDDQAIPVGFQRRMIAQSPSVEMEGIAAGGADHMVMISRPEELAELLVRIAGGVRASKANDSVV